MIAGVITAAVVIPKAMAYATVAAGRAFVNSEEPPPRGNQELLATGLANAGGAVLGAMPAGGGTSQTAEVLAVVQRSSPGEVLGRERMHFTLEPAVAKYLALPATERAACHWFRGQEVGANRGIWALVEGWVGVLSQTCTSPR